MQMMEAPQSRTEPLSIVVVDDDVDGADGMARLLQTMGHHVRVAYGGEEAMQLLARGPADVVISDSRMPGIDGLALCRAIRARDEPYVYFVLVTGLDEKTHVVEAMRSGVDDYVTKPVDVDIFAARLIGAERVVRLHRALRARQRQLRRDSERNFHAARHDPLTGARNRRALDEDLRAAWTDSRRYGSSCAVAMCDLDHFKAYNDALGHLAGDDALRRVVKTIDSELRTGDSVYRFGGEEFVVLLPHQDLARGTAAMERVRRAVENTHVDSTGEHLVTLSIGVAQIDAHDATESAVLRRADEALYRAKVAGRNRVAT
jgi:diguanylate cyclase (GGDEF)-like protein